MPKEVLKKESVDTDLILVEVRFLTGCFSR